MFQLFEEKKKQLNRMLTERWYEFHKIGRISVYLMQTIGLVNENRQQYDL